MVGRACLSHPSLDPILPVDVLSRHKAYDYFLKRPRIRFLLANDPGAGKTSMAGPLVKELKIHGLAQRSRNMFRSGRAPRHLWPIGERLEPRFGRLGREYRQVKSPFPPDVRPSG